MSIRTRIILHRNDNGVSEYAGAVTVDLPADITMKLIRDYFEGHLVAGKPRPKQPAIAAKKSVAALSRGQRS